MHSLTDFAQLQEKRFAATNAAKDAPSTPRERVYIQLAKIGEEYGELCEAILASAGHQRAEKLAAHTDEHVAAEMADVVITVFILAARMGMNLPAAIEKKIAVINERFKDVVVE